jgi:deoxyribodipyrimidine photo-lyase
MNSPRTLVWFRRDLRLHDNPALSEAIERGLCIPVFIFAPAEEAPWQPGAASRWWLHHSLLALDRSLGAIGGRLILRSSHDSLAALQALIAETGASGVYWNRLYDPGLIERDRNIKQTLRAAGLAVRSFPASLLREPWEVCRLDGGHYRAFTPFWRRLSADGPATAERPTPSALQGPANWPDSLPVAALGLLPAIRWDSAFAQAWTPGESAALRRLHGFVDQHIDRYDQTRDLPAQAGTSGLSAHLHWGEISPRLIWGTVSRDHNDSRNRFLSEIGWREFAHHLLFHYPDMPERPLDRRFERFPWAADADAALNAWQHGRTGIPIVDAGMRQLWALGWMHNRVRMIVGSLLTKNLLIPWQRGAAWFWDTLVDADLASNSMGWQWVQGSGADAAPYFRIFNPVLQGERFDPDGDYVKRWIPELARVPGKYIHQPWAAPAAVLRAAGVRLGADYPLPIVDLSASRKAALEAFQHIRTEQA